MTKTLATLRIKSSEGNYIDFLDNQGLYLDDPYWNPNIAQYKGGGITVDSQLAEGSQLVYKQFDNVIETIPLTLKGIDQSEAMQVLQSFLDFLKKSADYHTNDDEYEYWWLEAQLAEEGNLPAYSLIKQARIANITNPFGQPFYSVFDTATMHGLSLIIEREPFWRGVEPGSVLGPFYNLINNPDFEFWNSGIVDKQPDSWTDIETAGITGTNNQESSLPYNGNFALKIDVTASTSSGRSKGVTQTLSDVKSNTTYTIVGWVRNEGVTNGQGRVLVTYASQLEVYLDNTFHGWQVFADTITTGDNDTVGIHLEILTTGTNTDGTIYFDSLMFIEGDYVAEALNNTLPYISGSHIVNHFGGKSTSPQGKLNYVDVWKVPGNVDALIQLEVQNDTTPADTTSIVEVIKKLRIGQRRTKDVFNFQNYNDPDGIADTTASGGDYVNLAVLGQDWKEITSKLINSAADTIDNEGRFRVLARVYDTVATPNLQVRLRYFVGSAGAKVKTLEGVSAPIGANWCIVDLTEVLAMLFNFKFAIAPPNQFGYAIDVKRIAGSNAARLDYSIVMPTDGGYVEIEVDLPLTQGNAIITENVLNRNSVKATLLREGWNNIFVSTADNSVNDVIYFKGSLYATMTDTGGTTARIKKQASDGVTWSTIFSTTTGTAFLRFAVYNNRLYAGANGGNVYVTADGIAWSLAFSTGQTSVSGLKAFGGYLWAATTSLGRVYRWDESSLVLSYDPGYTAINTSAFEIFNSELYLRYSSTSQVRGEVHKLDNTSGNWNLNLSTGLRQVRDLAVFKGKLYASAFTTVGTNFLYSYDGNTWSSISVASLSTDLIDQMEVFNELLYIGFQSTAPSAQGSLITTDDGTTFTDLTEPFPDQPVTIKIVNGLLFVGTQSPGSTSTIYTFTNEDTFYNLSNYKGSLFTSPHTKRHRYIFNWDRNNSINNISDQALIGIGFVPRYLTIRGAK